MSTFHPAHRGLFAAIAALVLVTVAAWVAPRASARAEAVTPTEVSVSYGGRTATVPASWPVFDLETAPSTCARFNRSAVYLGHPGGVQQCPAGTKGLAEVLQIERIDDVSADRAASATVTLGDGERVPAWMSASGGRQFTVTLRDAGLLVTAGFYDDPTPVLDAIAQLNRVVDAPAAPDIPEATVVPADPEPPVTAPPTPIAPMVPSTVPSTSETSVAPTLPAPGPTGAPSPGEVAPAAMQISASWSTTATGGGVTLPAMSAAPEAGPLKAGNIVGFSFDTCGTPSLAAMEAWLQSPYRTAGVYLGGMNVGCPSAVIDRTWVDAAVDMGWSIMPIYVGRQAPVDICGCASIRTSPSSQPRADGAAAADDAIRLAAAAGFAPGTIIYYDMEGYDTSIAANTPAVMKFLAGWTMRLHEKGYLSAVYSSSSSGIRDLAAADGTPAHYSPDVIWMANWNGSISTYGDRWVPDSMWRGRRVHQFGGARDETWGGVRLNIDPNVNNGLVNCPNGVCRTAVAQKHDLLGAEARHLRAKTGGEKATRDGTGRYTPYQSGVIVSSWENGVFEVHGDLYVKWQSIGATVSTAGFPRADTRTGTDGVSRYSTFQNATIWYTPERRSYVIGGAMRDKYNQLGNVSGRLRYPRSDEYRVGSSSRIDFAGGTLTRSASGVITVAYS